MGVAYIADRHVKVIRGRGLLSFFIDPATDAFNARSLPSYATVTNVPIVFASGESVKVEVKL